VLAVHAHLSAEARPLLLLLLLLLLLRAKTAL
jgi:hypothetical protein